MIKTLCIGTFLVAVLAVAGFIALIFLNDGSARPTTTDPGPAPDKRPENTSTGRPGKRGEVGHLDMGGHAVVWVAIDKAALDELQAFSRAENEAGVKEMMYSGRILVCSKGTTVSVVDPGILTTTVQIMDGKHAGQRGVVPNEWLTK